VTAATIDSATPHLRARRLVHVERTGKTCATCGYPIDAPGEALELDHGSVHVGCGGDRELATRGGV
jgi:hypothetical protein